MLNQKTITNMQNYQQTFIRIIKLNEKENKLFSSFLLYLFKIKNSFYSCVLNEIIFVCFFPDLFDGC